MHMHMHTRVRERVLCVHTHGATARQRARGRAGGPCHGYARYGYLVCACELVEQEGLARVVQAEHAHHRRRTPREGVPVLDGHLARVGRRGPVEVWAGGASSATGGARFGSIRCLGASTTAAVREVRKGAGALLTGTDPIGGIDAHVVRESESIPAAPEAARAALAPWLQTGFWFAGDGGKNFTFWMLGVAIHLGRPIAVVERNGSAFLPALRIEDVSVSAG